MHRKKRGQSTLEYIIVFVAIIAAILVFAYSRLRPSIGNLFDGTANKITNSAQTFSNASLGD